LGFILGPDRRSRILVVVAIVDLLERILLGRNWKLIQEALEGFF
jgi:hypothetical protein